KEESVDGVRAYTELAAAIALRDRIAANRLAALGEDEVRRVDLGRGARGAAADKDAVRFREVRLPEQPVEAEFLQVVLGDFHELRLNFDLLDRGFGARNLNDALIEVELLIGIFHDQRRGRLAIHGKGAGAEND